jgi:hypothetical protein
MAVAAPMATSRMSSLVMKVSVGKRRAPGPVEGRRLIRRREPGGKMSSPP